MKNPHHPRFVALGVHGYHINDNDGSKRKPPREPLPEWSVLDRAFNARPVARFVARDGEKRSRNLAGMLNAENQRAIDTPGYAPDFDSIIEFATARGSRPDGRMRRTKGLVGEREVKKAFAEAGYTTRNLEGKSEHLVFGHPIGTLHVETRRQETIEVGRWMRQAIADANGAVPIVAFRRDREPWYVTLRLDDFLGMKP